MKAGHDQSVEFGDLCVQDQHAFRDPGRHVRSYLLSWQRGGLGFCCLDGSPSE
ncbi:hypothetical protein [Streptomyces europaeiscabiei]|uniref:hypothetical protein n=1 Tax=Streptomyces europaeiscabiei TaxID=146819 RepID=UPI002E293E06|nr:hypothetical protein [Streptomyces europaeiscabiei]